MNVEDWCPPEYRNPAHWEFTTNHPYCRWATRPGGGGGWVCPSTSKATGLEPLWTIFSNLEAEAGEKLWNGWYYPDALCEEHYRELVAAWRPVYPELEALHELMEVFKHE